MSIFALGQACIQTCGNGGCKLPELVDGTIIPLIYIIASIFFIRGIKLMGKPDTARRGNLESSFGMLLAVLGVLFEHGVIEAGLAGYSYVVGAIIVGALIGIVWAKVVKMTEMPQLVALLNGFGGLSSFLVAIAQYKCQRPEDAFTSVTLGLTIAIGAIAFTGSVVAWGKLAGNFIKNFNRVPAKNTVNALLAFIGLVGVAVYAYAANCDEKLALTGILLVSISYLLLGLTLVIPVGGGDMPVIISLLNSFSGLAAAFAGLALKNTVLVVSGNLVGASGLILTLIMCKAMNKTMAKLLFASPAKKKRDGAAGPAKEPVAMSVEDAYLVLEAANNVCIIPGYGMAVAQAQHAVKELCDKLEAKGAEVNFAIHPVAGRMPGHMNVLLAEANVPYEMLKTADEMNPMMSTVDVAIVIGANDVVNPAAIEDKSSPIYGMPIVNAFEAKTVFVLKRGKGTGFSGLENPLFTADNTVMIYGDAKDTVSRMVAEFDEK